MAGHAAIVNHHAIPSVVYTHPELAQVGLTEEEARWAARRELGNLALVEQNTRAAWGWARLEQVASDARNGCGNLRSLASRFTSPIGLVPAPLRQVAIGVGSTANAGAGAVLPLVLQFRKVGVARRTTRSNFVTSVGLSLSRVRPCGVRNDMWQSLHCPR